MLGALAPPPLRWLLRRLRLRVLDLLEYLAHAGLHQGARLGVGLAIAAPDPRRLACVEVVRSVSGIVIDGHARIVGRAALDVNGRIALGLR